MGFRRKSGIAASLAACAAVAMMIACGRASMAQSPAAAPLPPDVGSGDCDRACLHSLADSFIAALLAHDPAGLPLAKGVRYSENGVSLPLPDGFWKTASGARPYRLYVDDPDWGTIGFFSRMSENGAPVLVTTRLRVYDRQISEIEIIVGQENFGRGPLAPDTMGDTPRAQFQQQVPPGQRRPREELMKIVNTYFTGLENNEGKRPPLFSSDCHRLENGLPTSNVVPKPGEDPGSHNLSCIEDFRQGYHHNDTRLRNRRILAIDLEHQTVMAGVYFDHDNRQQVRSYTLRNGHPMTVKDTMATDLLPVFRPRIT